MIETRFVNLEQDYQMISEWFKLHKLHTIPASWFSSNGLIVELDGNPVCAGFVYRTDSALGILEYIISNPSESSENRNVSLDVLISAAAILAKGMGMQGLFMACGDEGLSKRMADHGFTVIGSKVTNLLKGL